jgi:5-formyltetrahydrofolate cyclo-ligase
MRKVAVPRGASDAIQRRLMVQDWWASAFQVGIYVATGREPATTSILDDLQARGARVAVPVWREKEYAWSWIDGNTRWRQKAHGIWEPQRMVVAKADALRVIVVPGLAFDTQGGRLGHGGGHFDRLLAHSDALRVGLCFENRLVETLPMEPHDIPMDVVVTEMRIRFAPSAEAKLERLTG